MFRTCLFAGFLGCFFVGTVAAQQSAKSNGAKQPTPTIPGYQVHTIEGFNVLVSDETMRHQAADEFERKPLDVLDFELKTITTLMHADAVKVLRGLLIWVEWDESLSTSTGRGSAVAVYYGGHQTQLLAQGKHPLKAKNITILSMQGLTAEHQPKRDSGRCVILHEMTHAVHDQFLGYENPLVSAAYKQAMERKLYDPSMYASTNEHEFFAELTCAYFDQLHYYPRTRADLEKHDPFTYQFMQNLWGKRKPVTAANTTVAAPPTSETLKLRLEEMKLGTPVSGPTRTPDELKNRPVLWVLWNAGNPSSLSAFQKIKAWDGELSDFGLLTVADHWTGVGQDAAEARTAADGRGVTFTVVEQNWVNGELIDDFKDFPLALVFDHAGRCTFRGNPFDAELAVRSAVGNALAASITTDAGEAPKPLVGILDSLQKGKSPTTVLPQLVAQARSTDAATAETAKRLLSAVTAGAQKSLAEAEPLMSSDPVGAYMKIARLPTVFKGTAEAGKATQLLAQLRRDKAVALEFAAQPALTMVNKLDAELGAKPLSHDPTLPQYRAENAPLLGQLQQVVAQMKRTWPTTRSTEYALKTAGRYGLLIP